MNSYNTELSKINSLPISFSAKEKAKILALIELHQSSAETVIKAAINELFENEARMMPFETLSEIDKLK
jgi:hypothetical protein